MRTFSFCGTIEYMSPELITGGTEGHDFSVDWWSVGVLTYELLTGASPFTIDGERNTQAEISKRILRNQPHIPEHLSIEAKDFIRRLLVKEPANRLGGRQSDADQLKMHPFLANINWTSLAQKKLKAPFKPKIRHELDVSNFADEFTSMAPQVLVYSSNNNSSHHNTNTLINDNNSETLPPHMQQQHYHHNQPQSSTATCSSSIRFSRLFKGYSYVNPQAVEWLKAEEKNDHLLVGKRATTTTTRSSKKRNLASVSDNMTSNLAQEPKIKRMQFIDHQFNYDFIKNNFYTQQQQVTAAKAEPIDELIEFDEDDEVEYIGCFRAPQQQQFNKFETMMESADIIDNSNLRVAFTIGDGEDLTSAVRSVRPSPEKLIVAKRKPSLELLYEKHANYQTTAPTKTHQTASHFATSAATTSVTSIISNYINNTKLSIKTIRILNSATSNRNDLDSHRDGDDKSDKIEDKKASYDSKKRIILNVKPKLGSIKYDPHCDFFKIYHLVNPLNSKRDLLGDGAYSICKRCVHKETGKEYAVKIRTLQCPSTNREIEMLMKCQGHPNIVRLYDVFQDRYNSYLVFELLKGGELFNRITNRKRKTSSRQALTEKDISRIFREIVLTVNFLHTNRIVHRDLKPENLLFEDSSPTSRIKLIDFGFARELPDLDSETGMRSPCVTLDYCAPEVLSQAVRADSGIGISYNSEFSSSLTSGTTPPNINNQSDLISDNKLLSSYSSLDGYDESCDLWSLGVILYAMFNGRPPFKDYTINSRPLMNLENRIRNHPLIFDGPAWTNISQEPKSIIAGLLNLDPKKRLTIQDLLENDWVKDFDQ